MEPSIGSRVNHTGYYGTVRYVGPVAGTTGIWLGIEWDDPRRGKHDGSKGGYQYFTCRVPNAGSFLRPSANLSYGRSFLDALVSKYIETPHGSGTPEVIILGSSHGAIEVEAVRLDKIRGKLSNLAELREVSLDNENVAKGDPPGTIQTTCPNIRGLDLTKSLLPSWAVVAGITAELPRLQHLALNQNRLQCAANDIVMRNAFLELTELLLNRTMTTWPEIQQIISMMPKLRLVEIGYNSLTALSASNVSPANVSDLQNINLDTNNCHDWENICDALRQYDRLQRVILTSNCIGSVPFPDHPHQPLPGLKHLSLSKNLLKSWNDIDALASWCPGLESLTLSDNPIMNNLESGKHARPFAISRLPSLLTLDGAAITSKERIDCELFYLTSIVQGGPNSDEERSKAHPQWEALCAKHGTPDETSTRLIQTKLSSKLIALRIYRVSHRSPITSGEVDELADAAKHISILPTMTLRTLRTKIARALKIDSRSSGWMLSLIMRDRTLSELSHSDDAQDLAWLGLDNDSEVVVHTSEQ